MMYCVNGCGRVVWQRLRCVWCFCVVIFGVVVPGWGMTPAVLVDDGLNEHLVQLTGIGQETVMFFDDQRTLRRESITGYMQLRLLDVGDRAGARAGAGAGAGNDVVGDDRVCVDLVDGQRLCARWSGVGEDGQSLRLVHDQLGEFEIRLDQLRRLTFVQAIELGQVDGDWGEAETEIQTETEMLAVAVDRVVLRNGDSLDGFVDGIDDDGLMLSPVDDGGALMVLGCDRVGSVWLANPLVRSGGSYHMVVLRDGSWVRVAGLELGNDQWQMRPVLGLSMQPVRLDLDDVLRIEIAVSDGYWVGLHELPMRVVDGGDVLGWPTPPMWRGDDLLMHSPLRLRFELPAGAKRMIGTVLFGGVDELASAWGDVEIHMTTSNESPPPPPSAAPDFPDKLSESNDLSIAPWLGSYHMNAQRWQARVDVRLDERGDASFLFIDVDPADNGPIMDRVRLVEPRVFIESR